MGAGPTNLPLSLKPSANSTVGSSLDYPKTSRLTLCEKYGLTVCTAGALSRKVPAMYGPAKSGPFAYPGTRPTVSLRLRSGPPALPDFDPHILSRIFPQIAQHSFKLANRPVQGLVKLLIGEKSAHTPFARIQ